MVGCAVLHRAATKVAARQHERIDVSTTILLSVLQTAEGNHNLLLEPLEDWVGVEAYIACGRAEW